jgi:hypothetical protein
MAHSDINWYSTGTFGSTGGVFEYMLDSRRRRTKSAIHLKTLK